MKIGILTFHRAVNYGACLQAYALKRYLEKKDIEAYIIDYRCKFIEDLYTNPFCKEFSFKSKIRNILTWHVQKKRNAAFDEFITQYLGCNERTSLFSKDELSNIEKKFDGIIVGSDQVWSTLCTGNDTAYYLDFVTDNKKKFSYAASFGVVSEDYYDNDQIKKLLSEFSALSVREKIGCEVLKKMVGREAIVCLDPTFLLGKNDWEELIHPVKESKYIFVYSLSMPEALVNYAEEMAKRKNLKVIYFTLSNLFTLRKSKEVINGMPTDFVSYIANAEYVITNSFHGTAFAIIFNKELTVFKNANKNHDNSRLENIMSIAGIEDRLLKEGEMTFFDNRIDYEIVNGNLEFEVNKSKKYLEQIIDNIGEGEIKVED